MTLSLGGALSDAAILWRTDRDALLRLAGVFVFLPILAIGYLATGIEVTEGATPEQLREGINAFYAANLVAIVAISVALEFGTLSILNLYFQRGTTVRETLHASALRLLPWVLLGLANGAIMQLGFALFVLPGVYVFGRTWMMGAAYVAEPERGLFGAIERGFRLSSGNGWRIALLGFGVAILLAAPVLALVVGANILTTAAGGSVLIQGVLLVPVAAAAAAAYSFFTLVRIAAYRRLGGSINGM
ncbi:hypothetical protein ABS767_08370 [Sphingomonas sp. ST-64]|uniref:Glycerophosphoryl diester phosphodiesterase membrane domain-containing protein n=1 Tax=Sphingomonas plantiphila TaxID=3163295 RepID=A0ABW8YM54_9SPHN